MRKLKRWLNEMFSPEIFNDLNIDAIANAMNDPAVRAMWLEDCLDQLKNINLEVDKRLLSGTDNALTDLCARRKAFQDILEAIPAARRKVTQGVRHNPVSESLVNLDRVTV